MTAVINDAIIVKIKMIKNRFKTTKIAENFVCKYLLENKAKICDQSNYYLAVIIRLFNYPTIRLAAWLRG